MQCKSSFKSESSYDQTSIIGKTFMSHIFPLFSRAYRDKGLDFNGLDRCPKADQVEQHSERLTRNWNQDKTSKNPKFWWTLARTFITEFSLPISASLFQQLFLLFAQPLCLAVIIRYFSVDGSISYRHACQAAIGLCLCMLVNTLLLYPQKLLFSRIGIRVRSACSSLLYQKALRLSQASLGKTSVGQIVNLMSNDLNRIDHFINVVQFLITGPIQTAMATYIIWTYLGFYCFFGTGILLLLIPLQFGMAKLFARIRSRTASLTDTRLRFMHEIISGMRVIKMYCWEKSFSERIVQARKSEMRNIRKASSLKAVNQSISFVSSRVSLFVSFLAYVLAGHTLTAEAAFVSIALFNVIQLSMTFFFPMALRMGAELSITCRRIKDFLMLEEFESSSLEQADNYLDEKGNTKLLNSPNKYPPKSVRLVVNNLSAKWNPTLNKPTLNEVSFKLKPGDLLAVIGPVGAGKSSLLMSLLGELPSSSGDIFRNGRLSFSGQNPWIFNDSVYNNILLGLDYDHRRYQKVIEVCALTRDLEQWPFGDQTLVGEKGVQLSGGQKARIELARAVYRNADIYLMDDPLSAVDAAVADHIFEKCIVGHLENKIRVLVTHQIQFIEKATKVLVLQEGQSLAYGSYEELKEQGIDFVSLLSETGDDLDSEQEVEGDSSKEHNRGMQDVNQIKLHDKVKVKEELCQSGSIKGHVYLDYIRAADSVLMFVVMVLFTVLSQAVYQGSDIFLSIWTDKNQLEGVQQDQRTDIVIYSALVGLLSVTTIIKTLSFYDICLRASENLHNRIFGRLLQTPVSFFDINPVGRIMNRFSKDVGVLDEMLVTSAFEVNRYLLIVLGGIVTICLVDWTMLGPSLVLAILFVIICRWCMVAARDLRRFEGTARSPVFSHIGTTLSGLVSIRAFGMQHLFQKQFNIFQNDHSSTWFLVLSSANGLGLLVEWIANLFICVVIVSVILISDMTGGIAGLIITSALALSLNIAWLIRPVAELESQMTSVERIVEYQNMEQEAPAESKPELKPGNEWPLQGEIQFENLSLVYGNYRDKPVLKNLNFKVRAGEKVGIVGRTGAGKSSIIAALFRLTEPSGVIRIDGVDIQSIGLDDLRQKISIIPQDPVIYSGTIRYNLDPFGQYADSSLWAALDQVQLRTTVMNLEGQLDAPLNDSGSNISVGQRQLICLARAILRRNQILVLDEATANIDHQTDSLIQQTIRSQFRDCTVLTIAHRLNSIIDSDRILVLDAGQIVEFDVPYLLLQRQAAFYEMCQKTGPKMYAHLLNTAQLAHQNQRSSV